jgi:hypothetical protein
MNINPVFHVGLLELYQESTDPTRKKEPPLPDEVDDKPTYVVKHIVDSRYYGRATGKFPKWFVQYRLVWAGYRPKENSWKPYEVLQGTAEDALKVYHAKYPRCPRDYSV